MKNRSCKVYNESIDSRALVTSISVKKSLIRRCYENYLKFHPKFEELEACMHISVKRSGEVARVELRDDRNSLPKDLEMCIEQQIWSSNFSSLQLEKPVSLKLPISFQK